MSWKFIRNPAPAIKQEVDPLGDDESEPGEEPHHAATSSSKSKKSKPGKITKKKLAAKIKVPRPPRQAVYYSQEVKDRAVALLDAGMSCRDVAKTISPPCSTGTPIRWRQQARAAEVFRQGFEKAAASRVQQHPPPPPEVDKVMKRMKTERS